MKAKDELTIVVDIGNSHVKAVCGGVETLFVHKVAQLLPHEYEDGLKRYGKNAAMDFVQIDGETYAIGDTAESYHVTHLEGAPKYTRGYYGVLFAGAIGRLFQANPKVLNTNRVHIVASHASRDYEFSDNLYKAIEGLWEFAVGGVSFKFRTSRVNTFEEPFGGYARQAFVQDKRRNWYTPLEGRQVGIFDVGGGTTGVMQVVSDGSVLYGSADSAPIGMNTVVSTLSQLLKHDFKDVFERTPTMPLDRVRRGIQTGYYEGFGKKIDIRAQVDIALAPLLNNVKRMYSQKMNNGASIDTLIFTGGGMEIIADTLAQRLGHNDVRLADQHGRLQFSNVCGMRDFYAVLAEMGD